MLVNELAHLHGGHVDVKSEVGRGTTFSVTMPFGAEHLDASQIVLDSNIGRLGSMNGRAAAAERERDLRAVFGGAPDDRMDGYAGRRRRLLQ